MKTWAERRADCGMAWCDCTTEKSGQCKHARPCDNAGCGCWCHSKVKELERWAEFAREMEEMSRDPRWTGPYRGRP